MSALQRDTNLFTIITSEHGRMRREQRDISKKDLQRALKYANPQNVWGRRWKLEYEGVVYITDPSKRREITSYPSPLAKVDVPLEEILAQSEAKIVLQHKPELCVSHTVLIVDNSGSMTEKDLDLYRCRQTAAYTMIALELVAEPLMNQTQNNRNVVSLIEFNKSCNIVFEREPVSWSLYNKLLDRRDTRTFQAREQERLNDVVGNNSNYLPALKEAALLLDKGNHDTCALSIFFLSDGAPTDAAYLGLTPMAAQNMICDKMQKLATKFDRQLDVQLAGFGNQYRDFSVMEKMRDAVNSHPTSEAKASFLYCEKFSNHIGSAVSILVTSLASTSTKLCEFENGTAHGKTKRSVRVNCDLSRSNKYAYFEIIAHYAYDMAKQTFIPHIGLPPGATDGTISQGQLQNILRKLPPKLALTIDAFGEGVERLAFRCHLCDEDKKKRLGLCEMVAKETVLVERIQEQAGFHESFMKTQLVAASLAEEFNRRMKHIEIPGYDNTENPKITFLPCSVLVLEDFAWQGGKRGVLVETMLDTNTFPWCKWNNNAGHVLGKTGHRPINVAYEMAKLKMGPLEVFDEEEEEENEDSGDEEQEYVLTNPIVDAATLSATVLDTDFLQAFTHFTHKYTKGKRMVCDLQGIFNTDVSPPTFMLTDPTIHYKSKRRQMVFGRTDKGRKGMTLFFGSHECNEVCRQLKFHKSNNYWHNFERVKRFLS